MNRNLTSLNRIEARLSPLRPIFLALQRLVDNIGLLNEQLVRDGVNSNEQALRLSETLHNLHARYESHKCHIEHLITRLRRTRQLVGSTAHIQSQE